MAGGPVRALLLSLVALGVPSCAMSRARFDRLHAETQARNRRARDEAIDGLLGQHELSPVPAEPLLVHVDLTSPSNRRCRQLLEAESPLQPGEPPPEPEEPADLWVTDANGSRTLVEAPLQPACSFVEGRAQLDVTDSEGATRTLMRWPGTGLARDRAGHLVAWSVQPGPIEVQKVRVNIECGGEQQPETPFEQPGNLRALWKPQAPVRHLEASFDEVELVPDCTSPLD